MNYNEENNDVTGSGRIKGSSKDRVISFFYHQRYKIKLAKVSYASIVPKQLIINNPRLNMHKFHKISTVADLKINGIKYIEVDPNREEFNFDKYDYYVIKRSRGKGIAPPAEEKVKGNLSKIGTIAAKGLDRHIKDTTKLVEETQKQLNTVKINLEYPVLHREDLSKMYRGIRENINDLKYEYELLKGETNNRSYAFEEAIKIIDQIDQYDQSSIDKMQNMLKVASLELNKLSVNQKIKATQNNIEETKKALVKENIVDSNLYNKPLGFDNNLTDEKAKEEYASNIVSKNVVTKPTEEVNKVSTPDQLPSSIVDYDIKKDQQSIASPGVEKKQEVVHPIPERIEEKEEEQVDEMVTIKLPKEDILNKQKLQQTGLDIITISTYEEKIAYELQRQKEIIHRMYSKVGKVSKEINKTYQVTGYGRLLSSFGNIAVGMLTLPLTPLRMLNLTLGASLINKGIKKLHQGLDTKEKITINYKYEDLSTEIKKSQNSLDNVNNLITDSLEDLVLLRKKFIQEFSRFEYQIPDYQKTLKSMDTLSHKLASNQEKLKSLENEISNQEVKNKVMIKKISNQEY